jgi:hypothetical protein
MSKHGLIQSGVNIVDALTREIFYTCNTTECRDRSLEDQRMEE